MKVIWHKILDAFNEFGFFRKILSINSPNKWDTNAEWLSGVYAAAETAASQTKANKNF